MDWDRTEISELINLYRQYECLWNPLNEDYNNCDVKQTAWMEIACVCGKEINDVRRKIKHLRSAYVAEKKKLETSKEHGVSYIPNLFYFKDFDFLDSIVILRKNSLLPSTSQSFLGKTTNNKQRKQKIVDRKSLRDAKFNNAVDVIVASVQAPSANVTSVEEDSENDVFSSFGRTTALQLQQLSLDKASEAMSAIYQLIARRTLESLGKSTTDSKNKRQNGVISFETMSPYVILE